MLGQHSRPLWWDIPENMPLAMWVAEEEEASESCCVRTDQWQARHRSGHRTELQQSNHCPNRTAKCETSGCTLQETCEALHRHPVNDTIAPADLKGTPVTGSESWLYGKGGRAEEGARDAGWKNSSFQRTSSAFTAMAHAMQITSGPFACFNYFLKNKSMKIFSSRFEFSRVKL